MKDSLFWPSISDRSVDLPRYPWAMCAHLGPVYHSLQGAPTGLQITQGPTSITVAKGTEAVMRCIVKGYPVPMVQWFKDDCLLTNHTASLRWQDNGQLLTFRSHTL